MGDFFVLQTLTTRESQIQMSFLQKKKTLFSSFRLILNQCKGRKDMPQGISKIKTCGLLLLT